MSTDAWNAATPAASASSSEAKVGAGAALPVSLGTAIGSVAVGAGSLPAHPVSASIVATARAATPPERAPPLDAASHVSRMACKIAKLADAGPRYPQGIRELPQLLSEAGSTVRAPVGRSPMTWHEHMIWWHVYPLGFCGAPIREPDAELAEATEREGGDAVVHRIGRIIPWLDHLVELGADGLALGPIFASETHGYDTTDHFRIDPRLGDESDFDALVEACRERGIRVLLDGVFNHVGAGHPAYLAAVARGPDSREAELFRIDWSDPAAPLAANFEGHGSLVALDHSGAPAEQLVAEVMLHWLRRGADGWRLDAAYAVDPAFWSRVLPKVREEFPEAWFVGEVIHGDYAAIAREGRLDSVTQYELWKAIWSSLADANFFELAWALERHAAWLDALLPLTFVGNHDVTRIATKVGEAKAVLALVVLLTVGGVPAIYAGDEYAFRGLKRDELGGDDEVRPAFPDAPAGIEHGEWMFREHQRLLALRRRHPWLTRARVEQLELENERFVYRASDPQGEGSLTVELDISGDPRASITGADGAELYRFG